MEKRIEVQQIMKTNGQMMEEEGERKRKGKSVSREGGVMKPKKPDSEENRAEFINVVEKI